MKRSKLIVTRALLWLLIMLSALLAAGCGEPEAKEPSLISCSFGIFNTEGQRLVDVKWGSNYYQGQETENQFICDDKILLQTENHFIAPEGQRFQPREDSLLEYASDYGFAAYHDYTVDTRISGRSFRFYDAYGELLHSVSIEQPVLNPSDIEFYPFPSDDPQASIFNGIFVVDLLQTDGRYQLLDVNGNQIAEKQIALRSPGNSAQEGIWAMVAAGFVAVNYYDVDPNSKVREIDYLDFYDWQGQPIELAQDYYAISCLIGGRYADLALYEAKYTDAQGYARYDVLDAQGRVQIADLVTVRCVAPGVLEATQGWGDMRSGLMDLHGRWLGKGLMQLSRNLQVFSADMVVHNTNGQLIAENNIIDENGAHKWVNTYQNRFVLVEENFAETWNPSLEEAKPPRRRYSLYDASGRLLRQAWQEEPGAEYFRRFEDWCYGNMLPAEYYDLTMPADKYERIYSLRQPNDYWLEQPVEYYRGVYKTESGQILNDVLDSWGHVLIEEVNWVDYMGQDIFEVRQGFSRGLMNTEGQWLYRESIFTDLED